MALLSPLVAWCIVQRRRFSRGALSIIGRPPFLPLEDCALRRLPHTRPPPTPTPTQIRNLQRSEINELAEGFGAAQVGSSTMPQKRNPHKSERVCGLARIVRSQLDPTMETVSLEHERDLTNSSTERITLPTAACVTHYMLTEMLGVLRKLTVDEAAVERNLRAGGGAQCAERVMMALAGKLGRQEAHEILRLHAGSGDFVRALKADARVAAVLSTEALDALLEPATYVGLAPVITAAVVASHGVAGGGAKA